MLLNGCRRAGGAGHALTCLRSVGAGDAVCLEAASSSSDYDPITHMCGAMCARSPGRQVGCGGRDPECPTPPPASSPLSNNASVSTITTRRRKSCFSCFISAPLTLLPQAQGSSPGRGPSVTSGSDIYFCAKRGPSARPGGRLKRNSFLFSVVNSTVVI